MSDQGAAEQNNKGSVEDEQSARAARAAERAIAQAAAHRLYAISAQRLSPIRMAAFEDPKPGADNTASWVLGRYWYSVAVGEALCPALHYLEVTLRNALYNVIGTRFSAQKGVDIPYCWLDWSSAETVLHQDTAQPSRDDWRKVQNAKQEIARDGRPVDEGRLIAELSFGFWTGLFASHYGGREGDTDPKKLWPDLLPLVFPNLERGDQKRKVVADRLNLLRHLRNRAFHHEPLWRRRLQADVKLILETIEWIDPVMADVAREATRAQEVQERGVGGYERRVRDFAMRTVGGVATPPTVAPTT